MLPSDFSHLVSDIYAAASRPEGWNAVLRGIERYCGGAAAVIQLPTDRIGAGSFTLAGSIDNFHWSAENYERSCPQRAFGVLLSEAEVQYDSAATADAATEEYPEHRSLRDQGLRHYLAASIAVGGVDRGYLFLHFSAHQGVPSPEQIERFRLLVPHVRQAVQMSFLVEESFLEATLARPLLATVPHGVLLLEQDRGPSYLNRAAEEILDDADGLRLQGGMLVAGRAADSRRLAQLINTCFDGKQGTDDGRTAWMRVPRPSGRLPYAVSVSALDRTRHLEIGGPAALIRLVDPHRKPSAPADALRSVYLLSDTEVALTRELAGGHELRAAAAKLNIGISTARSHLKSIFRKLEVSRQQDMVSLVHELGLCVATQAMVDHRALVAAG